MARIILSAIIASLAAVTSARNCQELTVPISISARNGKFDLKAPSSNIDVTNLVLNVARPGRNYTLDILQDYATVSGDYKIAATYCTPESGTGSTIQVLTHGVGFDRSYWDFPANGYNYSYVNQALDRGYSTFALDRLGIGQSSLGEPVNEIQAPLEVAALQALTTMLREAKLPGVEANYTKVVHVGHSFGSIQTYGLTAAFPELSDGIALTGFSQEPTYVPYFLFGGNLVNADTLLPLITYPQGYLASADISALQTNFFAPGSFDPLILDAALVAGKPVTAGEILTISGPSSVINTFEGPVLVVTGDLDIPFCGGNCSATEPSIPAQVSRYFTNATNFEAVVIPGAGHGLNLAYSWPKTFGAILDFFDKNV